MANANQERVSITTDPLNVIQYDIPPLDEELLALVRRGAKKKSQILDGSQLEQHLDKTVYATTHVRMRFDNEDDIIKCVRMLQWSDERMRSRADPALAWAWAEAFREGEDVYFSVLWFTKEFFDARKESYADDTHRSYLAKFGMKPKALKIEHEIHC